MLACVLHGVGSYVFRSASGPTAVAFKVIRQSSTVEEAYNNKGLERELTIGRRVRCVAVSTFFPRSLRTVVKMHVHVRWCGAEDTSGRV